MYGHPAIAAGLSRGATASTNPADEFRLRLIDGETGTERESVNREEHSLLSRSFDAMLRVFKPPMPVEIRVTVDLPVGAGLGSSAALATAVSRALAAFAGDRDESRVVEAVAASETVFHGNPSGIDQFAASNPGIFEYRRTPEGPRTRPLRNGPLRILVCVAASGASTAEMVARVRDLHTRQPRVCFAIDETIGAIGAEAADAIERLDMEAVGELMDLNHGLLAALGVSSLELDHACHIARRSGALGAKLTGSGGGGCVIAVAPQREASVLDAWRERGWRTYAFDL